MLVGLGTSIHRRVETLSKTQRMGKLGDVEVIYQTSRSYYIHAPRRRSIVMRKGRKKRGKIDRAGEMLGPGLCKCSGCCMAGSLHIRIAAGAAEVTPN